ncbi:MAG: hypothetical protein AAF871_13065 [Pseudomonadota bacterium]
MDASIGLPGALDVDLPMIKWVIEQLLQASFGDRAAVPAAEATALQFGE